MHYNDTHKSCQYTSKVKVVPHVVVEIRPHQRFCWNLLEILRGAQKDALLSSTCWYESSTCWHESYVVIVAECRYNCATYSVKKRFGLASMLDIVYWQCNHPKIVATWKRQRTNETRVARCFDTSTKLAAGTCILITHFHNCWMQCDNSTTELCLIFSLHVPVL